MRVSVIGTGYVGLVTGTCLAEMGNDVVCHDVLHEKIDLLKGGTVPIYEPGLEELVERNVRDERLVFTTDMGRALDGCEIVFIAVGTPPNEDGAADRRHVMVAATSIAEHISGDIHYCRKIHRTGGNLPRYPRHCGPSPKGSWAELPRPCRIQP